MRNKQKKAAQQIAIFMQRLYRQKLTTSLGGNISIKFENKFLITPSQIDKENISYKNILLVDSQGSVLEGEGKPSMETQMHLAIYRANNNIDTIIHAHPQWATLLACSDLLLFNDFTDEGYFVLKNVKYCDYSTMGTIELAEAAAKMATNANILLLKNHGVVSLANSLIEALEQIEVLENATFYSFIKQTTNLNFKALSETAKQTIDKKFRK